MGGTIRRQMLMDYVGKLVKDKLAFEAVGSILHVVLIWLCSHSFLSQQQN